MRLRHRAIKRSPMIAEILSVGTELLVGAITNTNARFLSEKLAQNAIDVYRHTTVGDNPGRLLEALRQSFSRSDLVVVSGGLGPTEDDITARIASKFLGQPLVLSRAVRRHIASRLRKRDIRTTASIGRQSHVLKGCQIFLNRFGTAPGMLADTLLEGKRRWLLLLPGPPRELEPMFDFQALPAFIRNSGMRRETFAVRSLRIAGLSEPQTDQKVSDLLKQRPPVTVGIYTKLGEVELKVMAKAASRSKALSEINAVERKIRRRLGRRVFGTQNDTLASAAGRVLKNKRRTLAVAESCTGGLCASLLTDTPGSSEYFLGGIVAYDNRVKIAQLHVPASVIHRYGAVSRQTARHLSNGVRLKFGCDYGLGITGIAGPDGGSSKKPVGLVYISLSSAKRSKVWSYRFLGRREDIKWQAAHKALDLLRLFA